MTALIIVNRKTVQLHHHLLFLLRLSAVERQFSDRRFMGESPLLRRCVRLSVASGLPLRRCALLYVLLRRMGLRPPGSNGSFGVPL